LTIKHIGGAGEEFKAQKMGGITINVRKKVEGGALGGGNLGDRLKMSLGNKKGAIKLGLPINPNKKA
jgi:hypothetical protein